MSTSLNHGITDTEFQLFRDLIEGDCGISLSPEKVYLVENRLTKIMVENGCQNFAEFYQKVKLSKDASLRSKIVDAMTTKETLWFRDPMTFTYLEQELFPQLEKALSTRKQSRVRIWCGACSTGQEPYSIALTIQEMASKGKLAMLANPANIEILATDISPSAITMASMARYDQIAMSRGMPEDLKNKYFEPQARSWALKDTVKKMVTFKPFNLQDSFLPLGQFDVIFLRNVAIYFSKDFKTSLYKKMANALKPDGQLLLGASETMLGVSDDFNHLTSGKAVYYTRKH